MRYVYDYQIIIYRGKEHLNDALEVLKHNKFTPRKWIELGLTFGLLQPTLDIIEVDHQHNVSRCLQECLTTWLQRADNVGPPTSKSLANGLHKINEKAVAQKLTEIGQ